MSNVARYENLIKRATALNKNLYDRMIDVGRLRSLKIQKHVDLLKRKKDIRRDIAISDIIEEIAEVDADIFRMRTAYEKRKNQIIRWQAMIYQDKGMETLGNDPWPSLGI